MMISLKAILLLSAVAGATALPTLAWSKPNESVATSVGIHGTAPGFVARQLAPNRYELTFAGHRLTSRANVEAYLLYRAAVLTRKNGSTWFELLHLPGEGGADDHPPRTNVPLAAKYRHWQPHWSYHRRDNGWELWHPEWGTTFWSETVKLDEIDGYEAHAIIELRRGSRTERHGNSFIAADVTKDLATTAYAVEYNAGLHRSADDH